METVKHSLSLHEHITEEVHQGSARKTVGQIKSGVENRVRNLFAVGDGTASVSYEQATLVLNEWKDSVAVSDDTTIDADMKKRGNAGEHHTGTRESALAEGAIMLDANEGYWQRVKEHEEKGHGSHAATFNASGIMFNGEFATITDLVEWYAITTANQPDSDLTPGYIEHKRIGNALAALVGDACLREALRSGDLAALQDKINIDSIMKELKDEPVLTTAGSAREIPHASSHRL